MARDEPSRQRFGSSTRGSLLRASALVLLCVGCPRKAELPALPHLAVVPEGYGRAFDGELLLTVRERKLELPDGRLCAVDEPGCPEALEALAGRRLALDLDRGLLMADLSRPMAALAQALGPEGTACLLVSDGGSSRCLPFRPFSGDEFAEWLDAEMPLGKIRVVMRSDGLEVVADRGKVPGPDRYGPSLPPVDGQPDFEGLDRVVLKIANRFQEEEQAGVVPSPSMKVAQVARALSALSGPRGERFALTFLVYP